MLKIESLHEDADAELETSSSRSFCVAGRSSSHARDASTFTITQLTSGVRDPNRVNVFVNDKFALSLDVKQVVDLSIKVGRSLSEAELQELHTASEFGKLYQRTLEWVLMRPRSVWETRDYLKRRQIKRTQLNRKRSHDELKPLPEIQSSAIELVVERMIERGYVDDRKFAEFYVENRFVKKGVSKRRLEQELRKKHVPEEVIHEVLSTSTRSEKEELAKMIAKKSKRYDEQKLIAYLVRQGFSYQLVIDAVEKIKAAGEMGV